MKRLLLAIAVAIAALLAWQVRPAPRVAVELKSERESAPEPEREIREPPDFVPPSAFSPEILTERSVRIAPAAAPIASPSLSPSPVAHEETPAPATVEGTAPASDAPVIRVETEDGRRLEGARVRVQVARPNAPRAATAEVLLDGRGEGEIPAAIAPTGTPLLLRVVVVSVPAEIVDDFCHASSSTEITLDPANPSIIVFDLRRSDGVGAIEVTFVDEYGVPTPPPHANLLCSPGPLEESDAKDDFGVSDFAATYPDLAEGATTVLIGPLSPGAHIVSTWPEASVTVEVRAGETTAVTLRVPRLGAIHGRIVGSLDDWSAVSFHVRYELGPDLPQTGGGSVAADGTFTIIAYGETALTLDGEPRVAIADRSFLVPPGQTLEVEIAAARLPRLIVHARWSDGIAVDGIDARLVSPGGDVAEDDFYFDAGTVTFDPAPPGPHLLIVRGALRTVEVPADGVAEVAIEIPEPCPSENLPSDRSARVILRTTLAENWGLIDEAGREFPAQSREPPTFEVAPGRYLVHGSRFDIPASVVAIGGRTVEVNVPAEWATASADVRVTGVLGETMGWIDVELPSGAQLLQLTPGRDDDGSAHLVIAGLPVGVPIVIRAEFVGCDSPRETLTLDADEVRPIVLRVRQGAFSHIRCASDDVSLWVTAIDPPEAPIGETVGGGTDFQEGPGRYRVEARCQGDPGWLDRIDAVIDLAAGRTVDVSLPPLGQGSVCGLVLCRGAPDDSRFELIGPSPATAPVNQPFLIERLVAGRYSIGLAGGSPLREFAVSDGSVRNVGVIEAPR